MSNRPSYSEMISALGAELQELEAELEKYNALQRRRERLKAALGALEAIARTSGGSDDVITRATIAHHSGSNGSHGPPPTLAAAAEAVLKAVGRPLHIREIVSRLQASGIHAGREYESIRGSLVGSLDARVERRDTFTKPEPGTYGLLEWVPELEFDPSSPEGMSISEAIAHTALREPGLRSREIADRILPVVRTSSGDPRKVISTIVGQMVSSGRLMRDPEGRVFPGPRLNVG